MDPELTYSENKMWNILCDKGPVLPWDELGEDITIQSMKNYFEHGLEPGGLMTSILANDLFQAAQRQHPFFAQEDYMTVIAKWVVYHLPKCCYGSYEIVEEWCKIGGIENYEKMKQDKQK